MSKLDQNLHKRLESIREELDAYIKAQLSDMDAGAASAFFASGAAETEIKADMPAAGTRTTDMLMADTLKTGVPMPNMPAKRIRTAPVEIPDFLTGNEAHPGIDKVLEQKQETFSSMLLRLIDEKGLKDSEVYKSANIDRRLFSKIRGDEDYAPSKKTAISFCLALQLKMDEARKLLEAAGYTLSASSRFDLIIMYLIENSEYNIHFANIILDDYGEGTLSR